MANSLFILDAYKGLGTVFWIELFLDHDEKEKIPLLEIEHHLKEVIKVFEEKYSRFKKDSLLNELTTKRSIPYDEDLAKMLIEAQKVSHLTNNVFSIFIKEALEDKGYGEKSTSQKYIAPSTEVSNVIIDKNTISITGNKGIDLGGIGKGYLIDKLTTILQQDYNIPYFLINGGGDIYLTSNHGKKVEIFLEHPVNEGEYFNKIHLKNTAFCCSSSFKRRWTKDGKDVNHFIAKEEVWAASYLTGKTATITDMYATVFCILANEPEKLEALKIALCLEYLVIKDDGKIIISKNFPALLE